MSKKRMIIILGLVVAFLPFLGVPRSVREGFSTLVGIMIAILAFLLKRKPYSENVEIKSNTFTQNGAHAEFGTHQNKENNIPSI